MKYLKFEVIADYPGMIHSVGDEIKTYESGIAYLVKLSGKYGDGSDKGSCLDYPHLFKLIATEETYESIQF